MRRGARSTTSLPSSPNSSCACQARDYDTAAAVLLDITSEYVRVWGHNRLALDLHERLVGHLTDPWTDAANLTIVGLCYGDLGEPRRAIEFHEQALTIAHEHSHGNIEAASLNNLGLCFADLGETQVAIAYHEQALTIARELGDRPSEGASLNNLGLRYATAGQTRRAIDVYEQALIIQRELGHRQGEAANLGNLGSCYAALGETRRAIEFHEQTLAIERELGHWQGQAADLNNLGSCYAALGEIPRAIELFEQARTIGREIGLPAVEAVALLSLAEAHSFLDDWPRATECAEEGLRIADGLGLVQVSNGARGSLSIVYLQTGEFEAARATAEAARSHDYAPNAPTLALVVGIAEWHLGDADAARREFSGALDAAESLLEQTADNYDVLDTKALALCGLALTGERDGVSAAGATFRAARNVTQAKGVVRGVLRAFDLLATSDEAGILDPVRPVAAGDA